ncbi:MAG TPA: alpha/beta hydrolase [Vicinamibacterales bacterium]|nr:alpha/beta hydrolase [Vicinamibacterales bacterium]
MQSVHLYGVTNARPVIVSSGDGGWIHLGPHVARLLAAHGCFVVGFDVKAYLTSFTNSTTTLHSDDEPSDLKTISDYANQYSPSKPILIGISEGAGLSVLAASDPITQRSIAGVIAIGLPDRNELGWRWRDSLIYLTHGIPNEPTFSAASLIGKVSPLPLALLHSTHDEFVPLADAQRMIGLGGEPKRLWVIDAADHRFSDNLSEFDRSLLAAIDWVTRRATVG